MSSGERIAIAPSQGITHIKRREGLAHLSFPVDPYRSMGGPLQALAEAEVSLLFVKRTPSLVSLAVSLKQQQKAADILRQQGLEVEVAAPCGVVCVVGSNMRHTAGVMWRILARLHQAEVRVLSTSDSFNSVSCLVPQESVEQAVAALSEEFSVSERREPAPLDPW